MTTISNEPPAIRLLAKDESLPYFLLLLADETVEAINRYITACEIYVYEKDNRIVGVYALQMTEPDSMEIKNIAVDSALQNKGIGRALVNHAAAITASRGCKWLLVGTAEYSFEALGFYEKAGFERFRIIEDFFVHHYAEPIYENGLQLKNMVMLRKAI